jgi:hypothetical protein
MIGYGSVGTHSHALAGVEIGTRDDFPPKAFGSFSEVRAWISSILPGHTTEAAVSFVCARQFPNKMRCVLDLAPRAVDVILDSVGGTRLGDGILVLSVRLSHEFVCRSGRQRRLNTDDCSCFYPGLDLTWSVEDHTRTIWEVSELSNRMEGEEL